MHICAYVITASHTHMGGRVERRHLAREPFPLCAPPHSHPPPTDRAVEAGRGLNGQRRWDRRLCRRLARVPEAVAGRFEARAPPPEMTNHPELPGPP
eukprot:scaffold119468_cov45-Phaeocystis_antarctica.AAC.5